MKANELMIGDWVRKLEPGGHTIPVKVTGIIDEDNSVLFERRDGVHGVTDIKAFEPIPLTSEILEKNGFKFDEFPKYAINEIKEKTKVMFTYHSGSRTVFVSINEPNFNLLSDMVIWVHELQHILRHARIEKEIEL